MARIRSPSALRRNKGLIPAAQAAYAATGSLTATAQAVGLARSSVTDLLKESPGAWEAAKKAAATKFMQECDQALDHAGKKRKHARYSEAMIGAGIAAQRAQELIDGLPTGNTIQVNVLISADQASQRIQSEIEAMKLALMEGKVVSKSSEIDVTPS
jgi:hypothetical protein